MWFKDAAQADALDGPGGLRGTGSQGRAGICENGGYKRHFPGLPCTGYVRQDTEGNNGKDTLKWRARDRVME